MLIAPDCQRRYFACTCRLARYRIAARLLKFRLPIACRFHAIIGRERHLTAGRSRRPSEIPILFEHSHPYGAIRAPPLSLFQERTIHV